MSSYPSDDDIARMLRARARQDVPPDLYGSLAAAVNASRTAQRARRGRNRSQGRRWILLIAATVVIGASVGVGVLVGSRDPVVQDPTDRPVTAPPSARAPETAQPIARACSEADRVAADGGLGSGPDPVPGPALATPSNGDIVTFAVGDEAERFDPVRFDPFATAPSLRILAPWHLDSLSVSRVRASPDGRVLAVEAAFTDIDGGQLAPCPDVFVMNSDGSSLRRPFPTDRHDVFGPAWSPDGSRLAVVSTEVKLDFGGPPVRASTILVWEPATGRLVDLGGPCVGCGIPQAPAWSPDGSTLATTFNETACGSPGQSPAGVIAPCPGFATVSLRGAWQTVEVTSDIETGPADLERWADSAGLLLQRDQSLLRLDLGTGAIRYAGSDAADGRDLSPDGTRLIALAIAPPFIEVLDVLSAERVRLRSTPADVLDVEWSPDSQWIAIQGADVGDGNNRGIFLVPADGSAPARMVVEGGFGVMGWLPAAS